MILLAVYKRENEFMIMVYEVDYKEKLAEAERCEKLVGEKH